MSAPHCAIHLRDDERVPATLLNDGQPVCARIDPNTPAAPREILPLAADMNNMHLIENDSGKVV